LIIFRPFPAQLLSTKRDMMNRSRTVLPQAGKGAHQAAVAETGRLREVCQRIEL
jgi:hypothetical protein